MEIEEKFELTRRLLKVILKYRFPVEVATKSKLVLRDLDIVWEEPNDSRTLYYKFLEKNYPELLTKYKSLYRIFFSPSKE